jgi:hypothetical protein
MSAGEGTRHDAPPMVLPPWLVAGVAREPLRETLGRARWVLASYWLLLVSSYVVLFATAMRWWHGDIAMTGVMLAASAVGVAVGNALALARVRPWLVQLGAHGTLMLSCLSIIGGMPPIAVVVAFSFLWSLAGGHLTLQRRGSLVALWIPMICWTAAIITILEQNGRLHAWQAGHKEGVWQPVTLTLLFLVIVEFFLFLAGQEHYHAQVWQAGATATPMSLTKHRALGATRITKRGVTALLIFAFVSTLFVSKVAPYFWRTGPAERRDNGRDPEPEPRSRRPNRGPEPDWDALKRSITRALREAEKQARDVLPFVPLFLLNRPLRRFVLLRHLRRPFEPLNPSERAANLWRYVLIALGDVKAEPRPGESLDQAVERVIEARTAANEPLPDGLADSCEVYQRIRFGLGIPTGSIEALQASAERAFVTVRAPMTRWQRVASWWRKLG